MLGRIYETVQFIVKIASFSFLLSFLFVCFLSTLFRHELPKSFDHAVAIKKVLNSSLVCMMFDLFLVE